MSDSDDFSEEEYMPKAKVSVRAQPRERERVEEAREKRRVEIGATAKKNDRWLFLL